MNNTAEKVTNIFSEDFKIVYYKRCEDVVKADTIHDAEIQAQKMINKMCSKDEDTEPATGMLHSIHKVQEDQA